MNIVSIQSAVAYGHVGNSCAVFPLQRLGHNAWPVNTVNFSNHTEYPSWRGPRLTAQQVGDVLEGLEFVYPQVDMVLTGYLGSADLAEVIVGAVNRIKAANPAAQWVCDPVIGNAAVGSFVDDDIPGVFIDVAIPVADAITPNQWELALLTGRELSTLEATVDAARSLKPRSLITSVHTGDGTTIGMLDISPEAAWYVETPRLGDNVVGAGDLAAAMYTALRDETPKARLEHLAGTLFDMIAAAEDGLTGLPLVAEQDLIVQPRSRFEARRL
ncbi:pyridoxal kinase [Corynebacterium aquatimens]|uniref:pyridoxal kinase n=1 Tax=Corynebacterium aquatimens TaxID=1190508 RepID=A0A931E2L2_9CORY|nr:pyridoxal kinase [Corynebacterium aquatimens]MBG6122081.1 pyridoxine kinase [Corynebacterium aquatimens]WJY65378.1 Pyridoxamine kinase [Corynebacterium aquatimens]